MNNYKKYLLTGAVVLIAVMLVLFKYWDYVTNPWTRNGQVQAEIIQILKSGFGKMKYIKYSNNSIIMVLT